MDLFVVVSQEAVGCVVRYEVFDDRARALAVFDRYAETYRYIDMKPVSSDGGRVHFCGY